MAPWEPSANARSDRRARPSRSWRAPEAPPGQGAATGGAEPESEPPAEGSLGWRSWVAVLALYVGCTGLAAYPVLQTLKSKLPSPPLDTLQHLWVMRWYKGCLLEGRLPFRCPDLQYPVGAPLGNFSPVHFQALLYLPLSLLMENDIACYNLIWLFGFVFTGFGTFVLIWTILRDRACACFGGMLAMFSTPLLLHSYGHVELIYLGWFPLFLVAWLRFVDRPGWGRLGAAAAAYLLVAMSAAYFTVLAVFPAALYPAWQAVGAVRRGDRAWLRGRLAWLAGFAGLTGLGLAVVFSNQLWAVTHGFSLSRPKSEFLTYGAPWWGYLVPTWGNRLFALLPFNPYEAAAGARWAATAGECASYLGVVSLLLIHYAAAHRVRFPRAGYWWAMFALLVVLSMGASCRVGAHEIPLPAAWLWEWLPPFRLIRVPARFNLFACLGAAVLAAAGLKHLLGRLPRRGPRAAVVAGMFVAAFFDLTMPFHPVEVPAMPACYAALTRSDPHASFLEVPQLPTAGLRLTAACGYWQGLHGGRTNAGYSGHANARCDNLLLLTSPLAASKLEDPDYLKDPDAQPIDLIGSVRFRDYAWLYLTAHRFRYIVLHRWPGAVPEYPKVRLDRLQALLRDAEVFEDPATIVYDRDRLPAPAHPTALCTEGWRQRVVWRDRPARIVGDDARLAVYNPDASRELVFGVQAAALTRPRAVRLLAGGRELARWTIAPDSPQLVISPPFRLPAGLSELTIASDGEERPSRADAPSEGDRRPYSLHVTALCLRPALPTDFPVPRQVGAPRADGTDPSSARRPSR